MREIQSDSELQQLVTEMRQTAVAFPFDPVAGFVRSTPPESALTKYRTTVVIDQVALTIAYTIMAMGLRKGHTLSLRDLDARPISDAIVSKVLTAFFGPEPREWDVMVLPDAILNSPVRKFIQLIGTSNETHPRSEPPVDLDGQTI